MRRFIGTAMTVISLLCAVSMPAFAENNQVVKVYGSSEVKIDNAINLDGTTMVPIRTLSDVLDLELIWLGNLQTVVLWNDDVEFRARLNDTTAQLNAENVQLSNAPVLIDGYTYLPLRNVAEATNAKVIWNSDSNEIDVFVNKTAEENNAKEDSVQAVSAELNKTEGKPFYAQRQPEWGFANNGSGYCWVCAYAMALTSATGKTFTPTMVAEVNAKSGSGAYMQHNNIISEFGVSFTSALGEDSPYFERYDSWRGATYIKADNDSDAIAAIKEALDKNPQGVMVRFTVYPHTLFAVGYSGDTIYFHEPAYENGASMTFDQTCLKKYKISDLDFLQVIAG